MGGSGGSWRAAQERVERAREPAILHLPSERTRAEGAGVTGTTILLGCESHVPG